jgi:uncharacterized membrane protein
MSSVHFHLAFTHFPIVGTIIGVLLLIAGFIFRKEPVIKSALVLFVGMAIIAIPVFLTGEGAEESVENLPGISEKIIHDHEELAEKAIILMEVLGLFSLIAFVLMMLKSKFSKIVNIIVLIVSIAAFGLIAKVGNLGGQIRHTEIRKSDMNTQTGSAVTKEGNLTENGEKGEEED